MHWQNIYIRIWLDSANTPFFDGLSNKISSIYTAHSLNEMFNIFFIKTSTLYFKKRHLLTFFCKQDNRCTNACICPCCLTESVRLSADITVRRQMGEYHRVKDRWVRFYHRLLNVLLDNDTKNVFISNIPVDIHINCLHVP